MTIANLLLFCIHLVTGLWHFVAGDLPYFVCYEGESKLYSYWLIYQHRIEKVLYIRNCRNIGWLLSFSNCFAKLILCLLPSYNLVVR